MRITLVHPAGFNFVPGRRIFPPVLANRMPPIGIMQLASWLEKFSHECNCTIAWGYAPPGIEANAEIILATNPEMVGFAATTSGFMDAADMALYISRNVRTSKIAVGNVHVSSLGAPILRLLPGV